MRQIFSTLEQAELLIRVSPHGSQKSKVTKPAKYLFMSPALRMSLLTIVGIEATYHTRLGRLLEDAAALHFFREFSSTGLGALTYDPREGAADFILQIANKRQLAIEIGIGDKGISQVRTTMKTISCSYGMVISQDPLSYFPDENIVRVPLSYFLLI